MTQCLTANYDSAGHCDPAALGGIEHPLRNLEDREPTVVIGSTLEHQRAVPKPHCLYEDAKSMPRVEWISNLTNIINMGVSLPGCITADCCTEAVCPVSAAAMPRQAPSLPAVARLLWP